MNTCDMCRYVISDTKKQGIPYRCMNEDSQKFGKNPEGGCDGYQRFSTGDNLSFKDALETIVMLPRGAYPSHFFNFGNDDDLTRPAMFISFESNKQFHDYREAMSRCFSELMKLKEEAGDFKEEGE